MLSPRWFRNDWRFVSGDCDQGLFWQVPYLEFGVGTWAKAGRWQAEHFWAFPKPWLARPERPTAKNPNRHVRNNRRTRSYLGRLRLPPLSGAGALSPRASAAPTIAALTPCQSELRSSVKRFLNATAGERLEDFRTTFRKGNERAHGAILQAVLPDPKGLIGFREGGGPEVHRVPTGPINRASRLY